MKNEPNAIKQRETSKLLPMVFNALRQEGITKHDVANKIGIYADDINALIFNLTILRLKDGNKTNSETSKDKSHLRIVK